MRGTRSEAAPVEVGVLVEVNEPAGAGRHGLAVEGVEGEKGGEVIENIMNSLLTGLFLQSNQSWFQEPIQYFQPGNDFALVLFL